MKNVFKIIMIALFATLTVNTFACNNGEDASERFDANGNTVVVPDTDVVTPVVEDQAD
jgi:hypothetical protein